MWISKFEGFYFSAFQDNTQHRLFAFDVESGTHVEVPSPDGGDFTPYKNVFTAFGQVLVAGMATDASGATEYGRELWTIDANRELALFSDIWAGPDSAFPDDIVFLDEFSGAFLAEARWDNLSYEQVIVFDDGTAAPLADLFTDFETIADFGWITDYNGQTALLASADGSYVVPWVIDAQNNTVSVLLDFVNPVAPTDFRAMYNVEGEIYALRDEGVTTGDSLWNLNANDQWEIVVDATTGGRIQGPWFAFEFQGTAYFSGYSTGYGREIFKLVDATKLERVSDIAPGPINSVTGFNRHVFGDYVYFSASSGSSDTELYRMDADENIELFADLFPGDSQDSYPREFTEFDGQLLFRARVPDGAGGAEGRLFSIDANHQLSEVLLPQGSLQEIYPSIKVYDGNLYVFILDDDGGISTWVMTPNSSEWHPVAEFPFAPGTLRNVDSWQIDMEGRARDVYFGDNTDETIMGGDEGAIVYAEGGQDTITTGSAADHVFGGDGDDLLNGGAGNDTLNGGAGADILDGGGGSDFASYTSSTAGVTVFLDTGSGSSASGGHAAGDTLIAIENLVGSGQNDVLIGNNDANTLNGFGGSNELGGGAGDDTLIGADETDVLVGGTGADNLQGGGGFDIVFYLGSSSGVTINLAAGTGAGGEAQGDTFVDVETVIGSQFEDTLIGNNSANFLVGGDGDDVFEGLEGGDIIVGGNGIDRANYAGSNDTVAINLVNLSGAGGHAAGDQLVEIENVTGSAFGDLLVGDGSNNIFNGLAGGDLLLGGDGNDLLVGGSGGDIMTGGAGNDGFVFNVADADSNNIVVDFDQNGDDRLTFTGFGLGFDFTDFTLDIVNGNDVQVQSVSWNGSVYLQNAGGLVDASDFVFV